MGGESRPDEKCSESLANKLLASHYVLFVNRAASQYCLFLDIVHGQYTISLLFIQSRLTHQKNIKIVKFKTINCNYVNNF